MLTKSKKYIMHRGMLSLIFAFALSVSAILSPLVRAEESPKYTWKDIVIPGDDRLQSVSISGDGSKIFALRINYGTNKAKLFVSSDDGVSWDSFNVPDDPGWYISSNTDGSKLLMGGGDVTYLSTNGGRNWSVLSTPTSEDYGVYMSPDGSTLARCGRWDAPPLYISTDNGQTWIQKGNKCPSRIFNGGKMVYRDYTRSFLEWSTDYGLTWSVIEEEVFQNVVFSDDANSMTDGWNMSLDGGANWSLIPEYPHVGSDSANKIEYISNDGKKIIATLQPTAPDDPAGPMLISTDGGKTWQKWGDKVFETRRGDKVDMSADGRKLLTVSPNNNIYRLGTLPTPPPVTPGGAGSGTSGAATPSTGSSSSSTSTTAASSSTSNKKPGKSSSILAETGISVWLVSGLAVVAVVAGGLALRKRP